MPGLMAMRAQYGDSSRWRVRRIADRGCLTVQTAVLIETLVALGAEVRWRAAISSPPRTMQPPRSWSGRTAHRTTLRGVPVPRWKGETLEEYWWCTSQILHWPDGELANMILDDGGDATMLVHKGAEAEKAGEVPEASREDSDEWHVASWSRYAGRWRRDGPG